MHANLAILSEKFLYFSQAAEEALGTLKSMLGQFTQKRSGSPRSVSTMCWKYEVMHFTDACQNYFCIRNYNIGNQKIWQGDSYEIQEIMENKFRKFSRN